MRIVAKYQKGGKSSKFNSKEPIYVLGYSKKATDQEVSSSLGKAQEHAQRRALKNVADTYRGSIEFYPMDEGYQYFIENEKKNIVINPPSAEDVERVRKQLSYDVFDAEFKRAGKSVLSKQFNGVKYLPTTRENVEDNINSIPKGSNIMYMDHAGDNMFGRPKEEFADLIASRDPKVCIGGSCYGEEVIGDYLRSRLPNADIKLTKGEWPGFNPNKKGIDAILPKMPFDEFYDNAFFRDPEIPLAEPNILKQLGGNINTTGYTPGYESMDNAFNIIPGNRITMANTPFDVLGIPDKGKPVVMKSGLRNILFPKAKYVTEIPLKQTGGRLTNPYIKEGFQARTADGHYLEPNNFRIRPSTLELNDITKIPGRFSTSDTFPNDVNFNRHVNMSDEQHKYLQDEYAKLKGMYVETARTPAFDPNEQFILDQDNARNLDFYLLKNRYGIKQYLRGGRLKKRSLFK